MPVFQVTVDERMIVSCLTYLCCIQSYLGLGFHLEWNSPCSVVIYPR